MKRYVVIEPIKSHFREFDTLDEVKVYLQEFNKDINEIEICEVLDKDEVLL